MVMSNEEVRRTIGIRLRPSIVRKARIRATYSNTRLGQWIVVLHGGCYYKTTPKTSQTKGLRDDLQCECTFEPLRFLKGVRRGENKGAFGRR